jgi:hypothetical protein
VTKSELMSGAYLSLKLEDGDLKKEQLESI